MYWPHPLTTPHSFSITPELPIDIVYTWVNGSDPKLVKGLKQLKDKLFKNVEEKDTTK